MKMRITLVIALLCVLTTTLRGQLTYENLRVDYDSAVEYKNLKIIPIRQKGKISELPSVISLSKAIESGIVTISERGSASTENVHWLRLKNKSNKPVFIGSGEIILGGRQDRMVTKDTLLIPTGSDQYIPVMCVEEGRWSDKERKFSYSNYANFKLRRVLDQSKNQVRIWREIMHQLGSNNINSPTLAYASKKLDKKYVLSQDDYYTNLKRRLIGKDSSVVGMVCISGDSILGADVFAGRNLFYDELDALLLGYIDEVLTFAHKPPRVEDKRVKKYLDNFLSDEKSQEEYLKANGKIYRYRGKVIHLTAY